ncbi:hypothetical protein PUN28_006149 [Cardiocondyla obscurior]|uniref:Uncharacterized protein n=1 Tax=Cardiocondyla obscurior TaxID=286306 RepID=A0AAW2GCD2_9HYME
MGERVAPERIPAYPIHKDLVLRIEDILKNGLPEEERKQIIKKFPPPSNCLSIDPPKLNLEIKASQERVAAAIASSVSLLSTLLKLDLQEKLSMVEKLSNIIRILADLQHKKSTTRRTLIIKNINQSQKETLTLYLPDEWLFGFKLDEKIKSTKTLELYQKNLKPSKFNTSLEPSKNWKGPLRRQYPSQNKYKYSHKTSSRQKSGKSQEQKHRTPSRKPTYHKK